MYVSERKELWVQQLKRGNIQWAWNNRKFKQPRQTVRQSHSDRFYNQNNNSCHHCTLQHVARASATLWQFYDIIRRQPRLVDPQHFDNVMTSIYHQLEDRHIKDWHQFVNYTWHPYCHPHHSPVCLNSLILHTVQLITDQVLNISHKLSNKISHHSLLTHSEFLRMNLWQ